QQDMPFFVWLANLMPEWPPSDQGEETTSGANDWAPSASVSNSPVERDMVISAVLRRTEAENASVVQRKMFTVAQAMVSGIMLCLMNGFVLSFASYMHNIPAAQVRKAVWGYVLSLDLGFMLLASQGYWSQDRMFAAGFTGTPELVMLVLVGFAWLQFIKPATVRPEKVQRA
ncbi:MAG: hypothetical protein ACRD3W_27840, partial [Terriglobales bacterium]